MRALLATCRSYNLSTDLRETTALQKAKIRLWLELVYVWWLFSVDVGAAHATPKNQFYYSKSWRKCQVLSVHAATAWFSRKLIE